MDYYGLWNSRDKYWMHKEKIIVWYPSRAVALVNLDTLKRVYKEDHWEIRVIIPPIDKSKDPPNLQLAP